MARPLDLIAALLVVVACSCSDEVGTAALPWLAPPDIEPAEEGDLPLPPPPLTDGVFPCSDCHDPDLPVNTRRRDLRMAHQEIELRHDEQHRWCLDCHDAENRDVLRLASGETVPFEQSQRLCGQCHGTEYRDWRMGIHGRRKGRWDGPKSYMLCVHCHDSHAPAFPPLEPLPPPAPPTRTR